MSLNSRLRKLLDLVIKLAVTEERDALYDFAGHAYMNKYRNCCYLAVTVVFNIFDCSYELFIINGLMLVCNSL